MYTPWAAFVLYIQRSCPVVGKISRTKNDARFQRVAYPLSGRDRLISSLLCAIVLLLEMQSFRMELLDFAFVFR